ncbi:MAG: MmcQ/YjbR family DNA-binding protein [Bacteroidales bacterium]|nr:MmcQ/YjbR family DNA-binding protein [Bacteroidales bacterium]
MNVEDLRNYCLSKPGVTESFPFDDVTLVMKVGNKMFALISLDEPYGINLKCNPELAIQLRETYDAVKPGYHMNKTHWNTVNIDGSISKQLLREWIDDSYSLIYNSLPNNKKLELKNNF